jgi:short-subunit dehydrogenase
MKGIPTSDREGSPRGEAADVGPVDRRHLLLVGAGPGLGLAVARRFAVGGYRVTLVARSSDGLGQLTAGLADTGAEIGTVEADQVTPRAWVPE